MSSASRHALQACYKQASQITRIPSEQRLVTNSRRSPTRPFSITSTWRIEGRTVKRPESSNEDSNSQDANERTKGLKQKQAQTPWHREGADTPPVRRLRSAGAMVKGKLLTTPSRLLKLTLPLTTSDHNTDRKDIEPLALLVHPHQPLSYLERLIQSEIPTIRDDKGNEKIPSVYFRAEDSQQDEAEAEAVRKGSDPAEDGLEETKIDGNTERTGVIKNREAAVTSSEAKDIREGNGDGGVEIYSGAGREGKPNKNRKFVRWSSSTEVGDFIRDAARGKEFAVEIEGAPEEIRVGVPSFRDRTYYTRQRLRRISERISSMVEVKTACDKAAHLAAQRIAISGFAGLVSWWGLVYYLTFKTDLGWDVMEPVTYLVGLSGLMGGYLFFLYHNREVSYKSALNMTISTRQMKLYKQKGFDLEKWENLIQEGNELRKEIRAVANEYDVEWTEEEDLDDKAVMEALRKDRRKKQKKDKKQGDSEPDEEELVDEKQEEEKEAKEEKKRND